MTDAEVQEYWTAQSQTDTFRPSSWVTTDDDWAYGWE